MSHFVRSFAALFVAATLAACSSSNAPVPVFPTAPQAQLSVPATPAAQTLPSTSTVGGTVTLSANGTPPAGATILTTASNGIPDGTPVLQGVARKAQAVSGILAAYTFVASTDVKLNGLPSFALTVPSSSVAPGFTVYGAWLDAGASTPAWQTQLGGQSGSAFAFTGTSSPITLRANLKYVFALYFTVTPVTPTVAPTSTASSGPTSAPTVAPTATSSSSPSSSGTIDPFHPTFDCGASPLAIPGTYTQIVAVGSVNGGTFTADTSSTVSLWFKQSYTASSAATPTAAPTAASTKTQAASVYYGTYSLTSGTKGCFALLTSGDGGPLTIFSGIVTPSPNAIGAGSPAVPTNVTLAPQSSGKLSSLSVTLTGTTGSGNVSLSNGDSGTIQIVNRVSSTIPASLF